jgi:hypothetical protein
MDEESSASREVISCEVMFVLEVKRRKSANHCGDACRGDVGESMGLGLGLDVGVGEDEDLVGSEESWFA